MKKIYLILTCAILSSCSLTEKKLVQVVNKKTPYIAAKSYKKPLRKSIKPIVEKKEIVQKVHVSMSGIEKHEFSIYKNKHVKKWIEYFTVKDRQRFTKFLNRGFYYKEVIQTILEEEELPYILYYLPLIESGFNYKAHSHAGAVGPWQFIKGTGKRYGLAINRYVDERRDPIMSTEAATKYLNDLYNVFNSWELAIAAYNCGEIRVLRAIMKGKTRDFWELSKRKLLPRETRNYVPKFLAAAYIGENLTKYKLKITENDTYPEVESVDIPGGVRLTTLAKTLKLRKKTVEEMNLSLKKGMTPNWVKTYSVWLPPKYKKKIAGHFHELNQKRQWRRLESMPRYYKVRRGDSLGKISRRFKVSINRLKRLNSLRGSKILVGHNLVLRAHKYKKVIGKQFYFVKKNDFLGKIANKFGLGVGYLKKLNGLHSNKIYLGQKLDVSKGIKRFKYRVKRGDNLHLIAKLYRTSISEIKRRNKLRSNRILTGQLLKI